MGSLLKKKCCCGEVACPTAQQVIDAGCPQTLTGTFDFDYSRPPNGSVPAIDYSYTGTFQDCDLVPGTAAWRTPEGSGTSQYFTVSGTADVDGEGTFGVSIAGSFAFNDHEAIFGCNPVISPLGPVRLFTLRMFVVILGYNPPGFATEVTDRILSRAISQPGGIPGWPPGASLGPPVEICPVPGTQGSLVTVDPADTTFDTVVGSVSID